MLSYPIDEAEELLDSKQKAAKQSLQNCEEDLEFLREQITVRLNIATHIDAMREYILTFCAGRLWRSHLLGYITGM